MAARLLRAAVRASALCRVSSTPVLSRGMAAGGERINNHCISLILGLIDYLSSIDRRACKQAKDTEWRREDPL